MQRRTLISLLGGATAAWSVSAQGQQASLLRIGAVTPQPRSSPIWQAFEQRMAELGYRAGGNFDFDLIQVASTEEIRRGYDELAKRRVDILLASGPEISLKSALEVTAGDPRPIVMIAVDYDPLALGYVKSLARPGGHVTGVFLQQIELSSKRLELVKDAFPDMSAATIFWDRSSADQWQAMRSAAEMFGLRLAGVELREQPYDYEHAFAQVSPENRRFLFVTASPFFFRDRAQLIEMALRQRAASMFVLREWVDAGGLLSYGPSITGLYRRAAEYADKIARGLKPAELPVEQPTKFELMINMKTAKALGLTIPPSILARADELIE